MGGEGVRRSNSCAMVRLWKKERMSRSFTSRMVDLLKRKLIRKQKQYCQFILQEEFVTLIKFRKLLEKTISN